MVAIRPVLLAVALLLAATAGAFAGPIYSANLTNATAVSGSPTPVTLQSSQSLGNGASGNGVAVSSAYLAGSVETSAIAGSGFASFISFNANMSASYDDIFIFQLIPGRPGTTVSFTLPVVFDAVFAQNWSSATLTGGNDVSGLNQGVELFARLTSPGVGISSGRFEVRNLSDQASSAEILITQLAGGGAVQAGPAPGPPSSDTHGAVTVFHNIPIGDTPGFLYQDRVQTPITVQNTGAGPGAGLNFDDLIFLHGEIDLPVTAQVGVPLTLDLSLSLNSSAAGGFSLASDGGINALHTFGVRQGGVPVFDLPDGYTANSESLNIVNNVVPAASTAVPEPGNFLIFGTTLLGFVALRKGSWPTAWRASSHAVASPLDADGFLYLVSRT